MPKYIVMLIAADVGVIISAAGFIAMEKFDDFEIVGGFAGAFGAAVAMICGITAMALYLCS